MGGWKAGERYRENTLVSYHGGLWISRADTEARPGSGSPAWRLTVKSRWREMKLTPEELQQKRRDELLEEDPRHVWDTVWDIKEQGEEAGLPLRR